MLFKRHQTFFGFPRVDVESVCRGTIAIIGSRCVSRSPHPSYGQRDSAKILRRLSAEYEPHSMYGDVDLSCHDIVDLGDFSGRSLTEIVRSVLSSGGKTLVVGGDHTTTYFGLKKADVEKILILDAHLDSDVCEDRIHHGCFLRKLVGERDANICIVGYRGYSTGPSELKFLEEKGIPVLKYPVQPSIIAKTLREADAVSLDLDFFDPSSFWCVRVPESLGFMFSDFIGILRSLDQANFLYFDIVEYCPGIDAGFICGKMLLHLMLEVLALMATR